MATLDLLVLRGTLIRLEDTICFLLIERAQFARNDKIYQADGLTIEGNSAHDSSSGSGSGSTSTSFLDFVIFQSECVDAQLRRYESPDEYPFTPRDRLPRPVLPPLNYPKVLHPNSVCVNALIKEYYIRQVIPGITTRQGQDDDLNYGSSATRDLEVLRSVSRRIHLGKFVAESKFQKDPLAFIPHIQRKDRVALEALITDSKVEAQVLKRIGFKASLYGKELEQVDGDLSLGSTDKLNPETIVNLYKHFIIQMTKDVEVDYLLVRLDNLDAAERQAYGL